MIHELGQLITSGAKNFLITGIPDVGLIPDYDIDHSGALDATEQARADAATAYSQYLDGLIRTQVVPALRAAGATVTYVSMTDGLNAILPTLEALHGLAPGTLSTDLLAHHSLVFFDDIHPNAQVHALFGAYAQALLGGTAWVETLPLTGADVDYSLTASIAVGGEVDKMVIALVAGTQYRFDMLGVSSLGTAGSLADPSVSLLNPSGTPVASDADSGAGFDAVLSFTAASSGNYTLQLSAVGTLTGAYTLQASVIGGAAMTGGNTYTLNSAATLVLEGAGGAGLDAVNASVSYALAAGSEIELLATTNAKGKGAINLTGNEFAQAITGNAGANILNGRGGADTLTGGAGKDVFVLGGGAVDTITDYASGDVVDLSGVLTVAAGVNVVSGGYVRVTTSGLIQVDANGGGDQWVTLANINSGGAVAVRYVSGGAAANVSVSRVAASTTSVMLASAVAAAGVTAMPVSADPAAVEHAGAAAAAALAAPVIGGFEILSGATLARPALAGEAREVASAIGFAAHHGGEVSTVSLDAFAEAAVHAGQTSGLPAGIELPALAMPSLADAVTMPSALTAAGISAPQLHGGLPQILADALGGGGQTGSIDALLDALPNDGPGLGVGFAPAVGGMEMLASLALFAPSIELFGMEAMAVHQDAVAPV
jgi:phospholipase/lecithinase/hemolysin